MPSTLVHVDAFIEAKDAAIELRRRQLLARVEHNREALASNASAGWGAALVALAQVHSNAAQIAQWHYLGGASLKTIALMSGRDEQQCRDELRFARAWLSRWLNRSSASE